MTWETGNRKKMLLSYVPVAVLVALTLFRLIQSYRTNWQIDFLAYMDISRAVLKNLDPYDIKNLFYFPQSRLPVSYPGISIFFIPFIMMGKTAAITVFFILNTAAAFGLYYILFNVTGLWNKINFRRPNRFFFLFWMLGFFYINSQPVLVCLRHGQISIIVSLGTLLLFVKLKPRLKSLIFSFTAVLKFSMLTLFGPLLFAKGRYFLCIAAFILFIAISATPLIFGVNLITLYSDYINELTSQMDGGFNTYSQSGYNMLHLSCFRTNLFNILLKMIFALLFIHVLYKEWHKPSLSLNLLLFVFSCTMLLSYHRVYDLCPVNAILAIKFIHFVEQRKYIHCTIAGIIMLIFIIPQSVFLRICSIFGKLPYSDRIFCLSDYYQGIPHLFPLLPLIVTAITVWSWVLYMKAEPDFEFEGKDYVENAPEPVAG